MRVRTILSSLLFLAAPALSHGLEDSILVTGARVLKSDGTGWHEGHAVVIREGRFAEVAPRAELEIPSATRHIDARNLYLIPGLIDLHSHLLLHPYDEASWNDQVLRENLELRVCRAVPAARSTLEAGFTTLRELGTEGAGYADVGLRLAIADGIIDGPRIFAATRALVATGCYGPSGFDPRWTLPKGAQEADGVDGVRKAVREQIAGGADWIKVYADYRRRPGDPSTPTYSQAELEAIVDEARSAGLPVAAHAVTDEAIRRAVLAGVRTIEHGYQASTEILRLMGERDVVLCPTLTASESMARYGGWQPGQPDHPRIRAAKAMFARALGAGVTIACGSDVGVFRHGDNARELELMVEYGMSARDALRSATVVAAEVLGQESSLGHIEKGYLADLVALRRDPLKDPTALRTPALVVKGGRVVVDHRGLELRGRLVEICEGFLEDYSQERFDQVAARFAPGAVIAMDYPETGRRAEVNAAEFLERAARSRAGLEKFREWITGEPRVWIDHRTATVFAPYVIEMDERRATGTDVFQFLELDGEWKIVSLSFTNRPL